MDLNSPRGTGDIFGEDIKYRDFVIETARKQFALFNYREIITPVFEHTEVFNRAVGESTDIVKKEMYTFKDRKGRSLTLRPEGTAPVVRAIIEHRLYSERLPLRLFYIESMFRYERPQKGRMREFWQIGVEAAGTGDALIDVEVIWLLNNIFENLGFKNLKLLLNSVGCKECRPAYIKVFKKYLKPLIKSLCEDCQKRYENNPLRIFDCKVQSCRENIEKSPKIFESICGKCSANFDEITSFLKKIGIKYVLKKELVRGFDYYTGTVFEIISEDLKNVQNALGGGGRYDNLFEQFGGPSIPSTGFAVGIDRTIVLMKQVGIKFDSFNEKKLFLIIIMDRKYRDYALEVSLFLKNCGLSSEISLDFKSISKQIKWAQKNNFSHVIIIGEDEINSMSIKIKSIKDFCQHELYWRKEPQKIYEILGEESRRL